MATDIKETTGKRTDEALENTVMSADLVTGAAATVADNLVRVVNHPVREAHKIERRGAKANREMKREVSGFMEDAGEIAEGLMPEKVALAGIHAIKARARRKDLVGEVAYRTLQVANRGLEAVLGTVTRLERATKPPARPAGHATPRPVAKARRTAAKVRRSTSTAARSTRSRVRRSTVRARRTERASA